MSRYVHYQYPGFVRLRGCRIRSFGRQQIIEEIVLENDTAGERGMRFAEKNVAVELDVRIAVPSDARIERVPPEE